MKHYDKIILEETNKLLKTGVLKTIIDSEPVGIAVYKPINDRTDLLHVYVNPAYQALASEGPVLGKTVSETWPELAQSIFGSLAKVIESRRPVRFKDVRVSTQPTPNKRKRMINLTITLTSISVDGEDRIMALAADTTDEALTLQSLIKEEERCRRALNNASVIAASVNKDLQYEWIANPHPAFDPETVVGKRDDEIAPAESVAELMKLKESVLRTAHGDRRVIPIIIQGKTRYYDVTAQPIYDGEGQVEGLSTTAIDVTDLKQAQAAESEVRKQVEADRAQLQAVLGSMAEGVGIWRPDGTLVDMNDTNAKIHGYSNKDEISKHLADFADVEIRDLSGKKIPMEDWPVPRLIRGEKFSSVEHEVIMPATRTRFVGSYSGVPIRNARGDMILGVLTLHDVTELHDTQNRLKEELANSNSLLNQQKTITKALAEKDAAIRQAYTDVISAVTGGKLVLMISEETQGILGEPITDIETVSNPEDLKQARRNVRFVLEKFHIKNSDKFIDPLGEALTNAVKHAGGGNYQVYRKGDYLQIRVSDKGPGIDFSKLPKATLQAGYSTAGTLGLGFNVMLGRADRVFLATQPGNTTIILQTSLK